MFNFTGKEKAFTAGAGTLLPLTVLVGALLAWVGLGDMPDPLQVRDAIVYFLWALGITYGVWQVPNTGMVSVQDIDSMIDKTISSIVDNEQPTVTIEENPK